jgi:hypothetical protein
LIRFDRVSGGAGKTFRLQNLADALISAPSLLEPGRICMISSFSHFAPARPKLIPDALLAA